LLGNPVVSCFVLVLRVALLARFRCGQAIALETLAHSLLLLVRARVSLVAILLLSLATALVPVPLVGAWRLLRDQVLKAAPSLCWVATLSRAVAVMPECREQLFR
jgi:hypothetical protein